MKQQVEQLVQHCPERTKVLAAPRQPMLPTLLPEYPWQRVAPDLFELNKKTYILVIDYFRVCRSAVADQYYISQCHQHAEVHLCMTWHSGDFCE